MTKFLLIVTICMSINEPSQLIVGDEFSDLESCQKFIYENPVIAHSYYEVAFDKEIQIICKPVVDNILDYEDNYIEFKNMEIQNAPIAELNKNSDGNIFLMVEKFK